MALRAQRASEPSGATIAACRRGDRAALDAVFRAQTPRLVRLLTRLVGNPADVEDLLQATFVAAIDAFPRFRGDASVSTWMTRIAVHIVQNHWRRGAVRRHTPLEATADVLESDDPARGPDRVTESRRQLDRVYHHLGKMSSEKRLAYILYVFDGRSVDEVAALMGASRSATRSRIFWARRALMASAHKDPMLTQLITRTDGDL